MPSTLQNWTPRLCSNSLVSSLIPQSAVEHLLLYELCVGRIRQHPALKLLKSSRSDKTCIRQKMPKHESHPSLSLAFIRVTRVQRRERQLVAGGGGCLDSIYPVPVSVLSALHIFTPLILTTILPFYR